MELTHLKPPDAALPTRSPSSPCDSGQDWANWPGKPWKLVRSTCVLLLTNTARPREQEVCNSVWEISQEGRIHHARPPPLLTSKTQTTTHFLIIKERNPSNSTWGPESGPFPRIYRKELSEEVKALCVSQGSPAKENKKVLDPKELMFQFTFEDHRRPMVQLKAVRKRSPVFCTKVSAFSLYAGIQLMRGARSHVGSSSSVAQTTPSLDASSLDASLVACTDTVTFTEVVEGESWGSFYSSYKTEQLITLWVLFVFTIVGNSVVLFSTWKRKRKSRMTFFVTQLAITDTFTGLFNILTDIIWQFTGEFLVPDLVCRVVRYLQVVLLYASTYVMSLSIDRYHAIVYPMKFLQGERQAKVLIGVAWSLSFLFSIPTLIIFGKRTLSNGEVQCWALWPDDSYWTPYMTVVAFLVYFIPLTIISIIYGIVIRTIWMKSKAPETVISNCSDGKLCTSYNSKAKVKAIKYSIIIVLAFIICWSPYFLFDMLDNFNLLPDTKERFYTSVIIQNLPALNSAINPLIYCAFSSSIYFPCRGQKSQESRMICRERSERHELQFLSKPEFI
ncbi:neuropeptide S receptor [Erethizon dorsatum]